MVTDATDDLDALLERAGAGDERARTDLFEQLYSELKRIARRYLQGNTWQTTDLTNEVILKLLRGKTIEKAPNRRYFFGAVARATRQVLIDKGRRGELPTTTFLEVADSELTFDLFDLNEALTFLEENNALGYELVQRRFFLGMSVQEMADHFELSESGVRKKLRFAYATLKMKLGSKP